MRYSSILQKAIDNADLSLAQISRRLEIYGLRTNKAHLSKLQNGKLPPAGDKLNDALANVLKVNSVELKAAAYIEKLPKEVLGYLRKNG